MAPSEKDQAPSNDGGANLPQAQQQPPPQAALQELLHVLSSPSSPQQQQQVLDILRSNPQIMAAFIKHQV